LLPLKWRILLTCLYLKSTYDVFSGGGSAQPEITALRWHNEGLSLGLGTNTGHVLLYDMRSKFVFTIVLILTNNHIYPFASSCSIPIKVKDHQFDTPIVDIKFHEQSNNVISACKKIVRIWDKDTGNNFAHIEPNVDINDVCVIPKTGMLSQTHRHLFTWPSSFVRSLLAQLKQES
jgi:ribosome biogenesis protein ENP2